MPCMKCTSAAVYRAPLGIVTGIDMPAICAWAAESVEDFAAGFCGEQAKTAALRVSAAVLKRLGVFTSDGSRI